MKKVVSVLLVCVFTVFILVACGGGGANFAGEYKLLEMSMGGITINTEDLATFGIDSDLMVLNLKEDGTYTMAVFDGSSVSNENGTWEASGNGIKLDGKIQAQVDGNKIIIEETYDGTSVSMTFQR